MQSPWLTGQAALQHDSSTDALQYNRRGLQHGKHCNTTAGQIHCDVIAVACSASSHRPSCVVSCAFHRHAYVAIPLRMFILVWLHVLPAIAFASQSPSSYSVFWSHVCARPPRLHPNQSVHHPSCENASALSHQGDIAITLFILGFCGCLRPRPYRNGLQSISSPLRHMWLLALSASTVASQPLASSSFVCGSLPFQSP